MTARVLMVAAAYFPSIGGVETHVHEVATRLAAGGTDVTVLATDLTGELREREEHDGIQIRRVRAHPANRDWRFAPGVAGVIGGEPWDLVHVQGYHTLVAPLALLSARARAIPAVLTLHSGGPSSGRRVRFRDLQLLVLRPLVLTARRIVAVSEFERALFVRQMRLAPARFSVIPNGAELPRPTVLPAQGSGAAAQRTMNIVSVGRLVEYKGHQRAIAAMPAILERRPDACLRIVGSGPYEPELRALIAGLGLEEHVLIASIAGSDRQQMADIVAGADVVVLLSAYESQGIAAFEALSLDRPLVVDDSTALSQLVRDGHARGVASDAGATAIAEAVIAEALAQPRPGPRPAWSWDDCAAAIAELYASVIGSAPA